MELVEVIKKLGVIPSANESNAIQETSRLYSKDLSRGQLFEADRDKKRASASELVIEMVQKWALYPYRQLEASRKFQR